jgi:hypothetical protein
MHPSFKLAQAEQNLCKTMNRALDYWLKNHESFTRDWKGNRVVNPLNFPEAYVEYEKAVVDLGYSRQTAYFWRLGGKTKPVKVKGKWFILKALAEVMPLPEK